MLSPYRRVLAVPGALAFSLTGLVARLPMSMLSLGIVLFVSTRTGSYRLAGVVAAAYLVGHAGFAVVQGRLADRLGQSRLLPRTILVFTVCLVGLMVAVEAEWPFPVPHLLAAVMGAAVPQIGSCVRARWSHSLTDRTLLQTAFALEAVLDEVVFVVGPILVTVLSTTVHPAAGLGTALLAGLLGTLGLAAQRSTEPPAHRGTGRHVPRGSMAWGVLGPLVLVGVMLGVVFGGAEVAVVAFTEELGVKPLSGPLLAALAVGSGLAGFVSGTIAWRSSTATRFRVGAVALAAAVLPLPFLGSLWPMAGVLFLVGLSVSPILIASVAWIEETVPARRLTEGISIVTTGLYVGLAPGAALVGTVIDRSGASASFWVVVAAGALGALIALGTLLRPEPRVPSGSRA